MAEKTGHLKARKQRLYDPSHYEFTQPRMTEWVGDEQIFLVFQGCPLNGVGWTPPPAHAFCLRQGTMETRRNGFDPDQR